MNEAEGCLEDESASFTTLQAGCDQAPSLQRAADGQCWWFDVSCDIEGLESDACGGVGDAPPPCGMAGAGGAPSEVPCENLSCTPSGSPGFCGDMEGNVWICEGFDFDYQALIDAGCVDLATQIPRFCCPESYLAECL